MTKKELIKSIQKPIQVNLDAYPEDFALMEHLKEEKNLNSRKDAFHAICNGFRGLATSDKEDCRYRFGTFCLRNPEKLKNTDVVYCQACIKARALAREDKELADEGARFEREFYELCGIAEEYWDMPVEKWLRFMEFVDELQLENAYLKEPVADKLAEIAELEKYSHTYLEEKRALQRELDEFKKEPLAEKCAWQSVALRQHDETIKERDEEIKKLRAEIASKEAIINVYTHGETP